MFAPRGRGRDVRLTLAPSTTRSRIDGVWGEGGEEAKKSVGQFNSETFRFPEVSF